MDLLEATTRLRLAEARVQALYMDIQLANSAQTALVNIIRKKDGELANLRAEMEALISENARLNGG